MKLSKRLLLLAACSQCLCLGADQKDEAVIELPAYEHTYIWQEFTVSKDQPFSDDRCYRLARVKTNGEVELINCAISEIKTEITVVKPKVAKPKADERPQTIFVVSSDFEKQTATIRQLRIKSEGVPNQSPEATPGSGTPAASAPVVPPPSAHQL
jgi:hypothetical protein